VNSYYTGSIKSKSEILIESIKTKLSNGEKFEYHDLKSINHLKLGDLSLIEDQENRLKEVIIELIWRNLESFSEDYDFIEFYSNYEFNLIDDTVLEIFIRSYSQKFSDIKFDQIDVLDISDEIRFGRFLRFVYNELVRTEKLQVKDLIDLNNRVLPNSLLDSVHSLFLAENDIEETKENYAFLILFLYFKYSTSTQKHINETEDAGCLFLELGFYILTYEIKELKYFDSKLIELFETINVDIEMVVNLLKTINTTEFIETFYEIFTKRLEKMKNELSPNTNRNTNIEVKLMRFLMLKILKEGKLKDFVNSKQFRNWMMEMKNELNPD
jgi:hypothetical protein